MAKAIKKETQQWIMVTVMFSFIIMGSFYFLSFQRSNNRYQSYLKDRDGLKSEVDKYKRMLEVSNYQPILNSLTAKVSQFEGRLPSQSEIPQLMTFLRQAADSTGIHYESMVTQPSIPGEYYVEYPYDMTLRGKYHSIGKFINQVENYPRFMTVDNVELVAGRDFPFNHTLKFRLSTYVYGGTANGSDTTSTSTPSPGGK